jgi:hypothetical protein
MPAGRVGRRSISSGAAIVLSVLALAIAPGAARGAGAPLLGETWSFSVRNDSARLSAEVNPNGLPTAYHFDYIANAAYEANLAAAKEGFTGASKAPPVADPNIGTGSAVVKVTQLLSSLPASTAYRYRIVAHNSAGTVPGQPFSFATLPSNAPAVLDGRGFELVSPIDKNGGGVQAPGTIAGGGVLQGAADGGKVTYSSTASFAGGQGAPPASQYVAARSGSGWSTQNITAPVFSGTYDALDQGVPYQLFSPGLARGLLLNGDHCRGEGEACAVANPPLPGTDAPEGYQDYYLLEGSAYTALLGSANAAYLTLEPSHFDLRFAGASPDLGHVILSSCAKLTANASEVALGEGCDPARQNLYEWSGAGLSLVNLLPSETTGTPGAKLAAQSSAVSGDGNRVYFTEEGGLYLREGSTTKLVGAEGEFQLASPDGATALYTKPDEHLYRYQAGGGGTSTDLTPTGGVAGVLGASAALDTVYYQDAGGLRRWHSGATSTVAAGPEAAAQGDWPPATGAARVSPDGTKLLFDSTESLTGYDNTDLNTGQADSEVFLYDGALTCVSCNPTNERPLGASRIPGALANGTAEGSTDSYKPRALSADGKRVFFNSADALVLTDVNRDKTSGVGIEDAYEWEAQGEGSCNRADGCIALISSGRDPVPSSFVDASADGSDAFFLTGASLVRSDPGSVDLYDARVGGGFPEPSPPLACEGDACQPLPSQPTDPTLDTLLTGPGNPPVRYPGVHCRKGFVKRKGECIAKQHKKPGKHKRGGRR